MGEVLQFIRPAKPEVVRQVPVTNLLRLLLSSAAVTGDHELACSVFGRLCTMVGGQMIDCPEYLLKPVEDVSTEKLGGYVMEHIGGEHDEQF